MTRFARIFPVLLGLVLCPASLAAAAPAGSTFLVSRPPGALVAPTDALSTGPLAVSADGRYVAFVSAGDGFAAGADPSVMNVFVRDTATNVTTLASRSDGANGAGMNADVGLTEHAKIGITVAPGTEVADAPHDQPHVLVVFSTKATNLVDHADHAIPATNGREEVWMRDVTAGTTYLVSRSSSGAPADGRAGQPAIAATPFGPLVAFTSNSTNLDRGGPTAPTDHVYLRELGPKITELVSCSDRNCFDGGASPGFSSEPSLVFIESPKQTELCPVGQKCALVAFTTTDPTIAPEASDSRSQVVVAQALENSDGGSLEPFQQWTSGSVVHLNTDVEGNASSWEPSLTSDGLLVTFLSKATNLHPGEPPPPSTAEGYYHSFSGFAGTFFASVGLNGEGLCCVPADEPVLHVSSGGTIPTRIGFDTQADNIGVPFPSIPFRPIRAYSVGTTVLGALLDRSSGANGVIGDDQSSETMVSADGNTAVFLSRSTNLGAGGGREFPRVYKRALNPKAAGFESLQLVSRPSGTGAFSPGSEFSNTTSRAISADGRYVAFESKADNLSSADDDRQMNVFVRDNVNGTTTLVSRADGANGAAANTDSTLNGISDNGQRVLFTTAADNFGTAGQPGEHAYVRDLTAQTTTVVTRATSAVGVITPGEGKSISGDGNRVAFVAQAAVDPEASNDVTHLYVRDLAAQTTTFVDRSDGVFGRPAGSQALEASLDRTGNRVAWSTEARMSATDGSPLLEKIYVRDLTAHTTTLVSRADGVGGDIADTDSFAPAIDAAGDTVAFETSATNLGIATGGRAIWVRRLATGRTELVSRAAGATGAPANQPAFGPPSIDAAGDRVTFRTQATNLLAGGINQVPPNSQVYVRDLSAKTTEAVSRVNGVGGALADPGGFFAASISASGDCVAFSGTGVNFTDGLASADFPQVRERVLRGDCGPASVSAPSPQPTDAPAAALSRLGMHPERFYVGGDGGGSRISFVLSKASPVTIRFFRSAARRRLVGHLSVRGRAGANAVDFSGRLHGKSLAPGRYVWTARPWHGRGRSGRFEVVPPPRRRFRHPPR